MRDYRTNSWLNAVEVEDILCGANTDEGRIRDILNKARELKGLDMAEVATLCQITTPQQFEELFETARQVKEEIYGHRMVLFAPLYISNVCGNECTYCAFRSSNKELKRSALDMDGIRRDTTELIKQGHKRLLMVAGEGYAASRGGFQYILDAIAAVYDVTEANGCIRRLNVNLAPLDVEKFRLLKEAGVDDVGMGVLFGLHDWRFEILSMMQHIKHLEDTFGVGCHTLSVPRIEPADHSAMSEAPPAMVSDLDFKKIIAILRLAIPYTGLILSTRESAAIRRECYALGISQISAGSRTNPGGYSDQQSQEEQAGEQFQLGDHRSLDEVVHELATMGFIPSFCTACYRLGRTGQDFMDLAKTGLIKLKCDPNAVTTFQEYLIDYALEAARRDGEQAIEHELAKMGDKARKTSEKMLDKIRGGKRDVCC